MAGFGHAIDEASRMPVELISTLVQFVASQVTIPSGACWNEKATMLLTRS